MTRDEVTPVLLPPDAREYWSINVDTTPDPVLVEAQFAAGGEWVPGEHVDGDVWRWLVRGPNVADDPNRPAALVPATTNPRIRIVDEPEIITRCIYSAPIVVRRC